MNPDSVGRGVWLARGMARVTGAGPSDAMAEGRLTTRGLSELIRICDSCAHAMACLDWLAHSGGGPSDPPDFCAIGPDLSRLAQARVRRRSESPR